MTLRNGFLPDAAKARANLQGRRHARGIVVRPVVDLVARQGRVIAYVVEVCPDDHIFVRAFAGNPAQDVGQLQAAVCALFEPCQRVRVHLEAPFLLPLHGARLEQLVIRVAQQGPYARLLQLRGQVARHDARLPLSGFASQQVVIGQKFHDGFRLVLVDALQSFLQGRLRLHSQRGGKEAAGSPNLLVHIVCFLRQWFCLQM